MTEKLRFSKAEFVSHTQYPGEDSPTGVLVVRAPCSPKIAESLRCRDAVYEPKGAIRSAITGTVSLALTIAGADLDIGQSGSLTCTEIGHFKILRAESGTGDERELSLFVQFRAHYSGKDSLDYASNLLVTFNSGDFGVLIRAKQGAFDFDGTGEDAESAESGETYSEFVKHEAATAGSLEQ